MCGRCGYLLLGLGNIGQCPECGGNLIDVLVRSRGELKEGRRYRSERTLLGWPLVDIAFGPHKDEPLGYAKGWIAIGDKAMGGVAIGGASGIGIVALGGGGSLGLVGSLGGGMSMGGLVSLGGGMAGGTGLAVAGGASAGGIAVAGGASAGYVSSGTISAGNYARGVMVTGNYILASRRTDQEAREVFDTLTPFVGTLGLPVRATLTALSAWLVCAILLALVARLLSRTPKPSN
jgi:hypothetical protein